MEKAKITQEQADKIWGWEWHTGGKSKLLGLHAKNLLGDSKPLQSLTLDELARAIYVGYEVEEKFKQGEWVVVTFKLHTTIYGKTKKITDVKKSCSVGDDIYFELDGKGAVYQNEIRHATESEIAGEEKSRMDKKINEIWIGLSDYERNGFYRKLVRGDY